MVRALACTSGLDCLGDVRGSVGRAEVGYPRHIRRLVAVAVPTLIEVTETGVVEAFLALAEIARLSGLARVRVVAPNAVAVPPVLKLIARAAVLESPEAERSRNALTVGQCAGGGNAVPREST